MHARQCCCETEPEIVAQGGEVNLSVEGVIGCERLENRQWQVVQKRMEEVNDGQEVNNINVLRVAPELGT